MNNKYKRIEELQEKVVEVSNSFFPLDTFLNDIIQRESKGEKDYDFESAYNDIEKIYNTFIHVKEENEKLKQLEAFEEHKELITLYEKLKNADYIWEKYMGIDMLLHIEYKNIKNQHVYVNFEEKQFILINIISDEVEYYPLKDYGKTWAFTKKELKGKLNEKIQ